MILLYTPRNPKPALPISGFAERHNCGSPANFRKSRITWSLWMSSFMSLGTLHLVFQASQAGWAESCPSAVFDECANSPISGPLGETSPAAQFSAESRCLRTSHAPLPFHYRKQTCISGGESNHETDTKRHQSRHWFHCRPRRAV